MPYPYDPGYVAGNQSSEEAAAALKDSAETIRTRIFRYIAASPNGKTCDEIEVELYLSHQTASARCAELKRQGKIASWLDEDDKKIRRKTRSGRYADVLFKVP